MNNKFHVGDFVHCNGEGNTLFEISQFSPNGNSAYLIVHDGGIDGGWSSVGGLTLVPEEERGTVDLNVVRDFAFGRVQPGTHFAEDYIVEYAQEILRLNNKLAALENDEDEEYHESMSPVRG